MSATGQVRHQVVVRSLCGGDGKVDGWVRVCGSRVGVGQECGTFECPLVGCVITGDDILPHKQIHPQGYTLELSKH